MDNKLEKLRSIASEHFDDYMLVVIKNNCVYTTYKSKVSAFGMAQMIQEEIKLDWSSFKTISEN